MNEKIKQVFKKLCEDYVSDINQFKGKKIAHDYFYNDKYEFEYKINGEWVATADILKAFDSMEELIKGKDEYIAKLCNDRAKLKAELKELKDSCEKGILKDKVICNVNLHYYLNKKSEIFNKLKAISNRLEKYHIQSDIAVGNHWGECWEFSAKGTTTLEIAEYICNFIRSQDLHAKIGYDDSHEFYLSA